MDARPCLGCRQRDETIADRRQRLAAAEARVRELEAQLGRNATNSSLPPSANQPGAPKAVVDYLYEALLAHRAGLPTPKML
jgi:hypothetical protein